MKKIILTCLVLGLLGFVRSDGKPYPVLVQIKRPPVKSAPIKVPLKHRFFRALKV